MAFGYRYTLERQENGWWLVRFPGIPEALTEGETEQEARANARDCVITALEGYMKAGKPLPREGAGHSGPDRAVLPSLVTAKYGPPDRRRNARLARDHPPDRRLQRDGGLARSWRWCGMRQLRQIRGGDIVPNRTLARRKGFEPLTPRFEVWCSSQLSYRRRASP